MAMQMTRDELFAYRAKKGWTAITIEICPHDPVTVSLTDDELAESLLLIDSTMPSAPEDVRTVAGYSAVRRAMADVLVPAIVSGDERLITNSAAFALWCALNHPNDRGVMRAKMAQKRAQGVAPHFTICRGPKGAYGTSVGDGYADMRADLADRINPRETRFDVR